MRQSETQITHHPANDFFAVWGAQNRLAFVSDRSGFWNIWTMRSDGSDERALTNDRGQATSPTWSPDGTALMFSSDRTSPTRLWPDLWIVDMKTGHFERITSTPTIKEFMPSWGPDGKEFVFLSLDMTKPPNWRIRLMELQSREVHQIAGQSTLFSRLAWSPNGQQIAFVSDRSGRPELWLMGRDGGHARPITTDGSEKEHPAWSPNGEQIAFASKRAGNWDLWIIHPDGTGLKQVTTSPAAETLPDWSPDGQSLVFTSDRAGNQDIWAMSMSNQW